MIEQYIFDTAVMIIIFIMIVTTDIRFKRLEKIVKKAN